MRAETKEVNEEGGKGEGWIGVAGARDACYLERLKRSLASG